MRPLQTAKKTVTGSDEMFVRCSPSANRINASNTQNATTPTPNTNESNSLADLLASTHGPSLFQSLGERFGSQNIHRFLIGSEQLPGLLEVERLDFSISSSTCQLRVVDLNASTGSRATDPTTVIAKALEANKTNAAFPSPPTSPTPNEDQSNAMESNDVDRTLPPISKRAFVPAQSKNLEETLKSKAEIYVLERHRGFVEQKKSVHTNSTDSLPPPLSTSFAAFAPTKTDNPSLYSGQTPMIVGPNFNSYEEMADDRAMADEFLMEVETPTTTQPEKKTGLDGQAAPRRTPLYTVEMENCRSAQTLQIVLDFRNPFILTDFLIPANEIFSAVAVDGWIEDEKNGTIRFAFSTDIENRSLCLSDLPTTSLIRYVRVSFTVRESRRSTVTFTLGNFYGIRFFSPWQLYACNGLWNATKYWNFEQTEDMDSELFPFIDPCANALKFALAHQELNFRDLNLLVQQLLLRYQTNVAQFKRLMKSGSPTAKRIYQQCLTDRILYNNFRTIIERSRVDMKPAKAVLRTKSEQTNGTLSGSSTSNRDWLGREESSIDSAANASNSWWDATVDELRFVSSEFMTLINEIHAFLNLSQQISNRMLATEKTERPASQVPEQVSTVIDILDLESAIRLFGCFVSDSSDSKLQAICCSYLFHLGSKSKWWPEFFPSVLQRHFVTGSSDSDVFIRLAYLCNQSVRHHDLHTPVVERLLTYMQDLISNPRTINRVVDVTQLSWLLLLLSSAFDVIVPNQQHIDRWTFCCW
ncbi:hypothetical protein M3Y94_00496300 [Aphelenchoides besseyi]|nr:hypothetical protein M3Y94_00496300 [Aphelenchoides besseyi]